MHVLFDDSPNSPRANSPEYGEDPEDNIEDGADVGFSTSLHTECTCDGQEVDFSTNNPAYPSLWLHNSGQQFLQFYSTSDVLSSVFALAHDVSVASPISLEEGFSENNWKGFTHGIEQIQSAKPKLVWIGMNAHVNANLMAHLNIQLGIKNWMERKIGWIKKLTWNKKLDGMRIRWNP